MARKKINLSIADPTVNRSGYGDWTRNYRQSSNVEDRRGEKKEFEQMVAASGRSKVDRIDATRSPRSRTNDGSTGSGGTDPFTGVGDDGATGYDHHAPTTTTRKVDAEEAIRRTHFERN